MTARSDYSFKIMNSTIRHKNRNKNKNKGKQNEGKEEETVGGVIEAASINPPKSMYNQWGKVIRFVQ